MLYVGVYMGALLEEFFYMQGLSMYPHAGAWERVRFWYAYSCRSFGTS